MDFITQLWIPIIASAAAVWVYSAIAWMVLPHHAKDFAGLKDEDGFMGTVRSMGLTPGAYGFPYCHDRKQHKDPAFCEKWKTGPTGMLSIWPKMNMGRNMALSFLVNLIISVFIAYIGFNAFQQSGIAVAGLPESGPSCGRIMQVLGTAGILAYSAGSLCHSIWFYSTRNSVLSNLFDGVMSGLVTGAIFSLLWT